jgi:hypothetical protein
MSKVGLALNQPAASEPTLRNLTSAFDLPTERNVDNTSRGIQFTRGQKIERTFDKCKEHPHREF